jgi:hypothetical protein
MVHSPPHGLSIALTDNGTPATMLSTLTQSSQKQPERGSGSSSGTNSGPPTGPTRTHRRSPTGSPSVTPPRSPTAGNAPVTAHGHIRNRSRSASPSISSMSAIHHGTGTGGHHGHSDSIASFNRIGGLLSASNVPSLLTVDGDYDDGDTAPGTPTSISVAPSRAVSPGPGGLISPAGHRGFGMAKLESQVEPKKTLQLLLEIQKLNDLYASMSSTICHFFPLAHTLKI